MGHKTHPLGLRLALNKNWSSNWFDSKRFVDLLHEDLQLRDFITKKLKNAGCQRVEIERSVNELTITVHVAKPGMAIGRGGAGSELLKKEIESRLMEGEKLRKLDIVEVRKPDLSATLVARNVADMIERRMSPRRAVSIASERTMSAGARGVKIIVSGRLNGADIARSEKKAVGSIPAHTLRADIDFASDVAVTSYGTIGVKVWVCRPEEKPMTPIRVTKNFERSRDA
jgi:small subunit ribosomal protein S3